MNLIYLTSQRYPSKKVDPFFIQSMAESFSRALQDSFLFVVRDTSPSVFPHFTVLSVPLPWRFRSVTYFFWVPLFLLREQYTKRSTVFFSSDPYLLSILIIWRKVLRREFHICSDWHQLFNDWRDNFVARHSDYLITTSNRLKNLLMTKFGVNEKKILVAYGGVDVQPYREASQRDVLHLRRTLSLPADLFLVGYIGGYKSVGLEKGLDTMIRALQFLDTSVAMVFVGGSEEEIEEYKNLAQKEGVEQRCLFIKKQPFEKVVEYELSMDVLVIPYPDKPHFREYGFPLKTWEYLASGRPILYSNLELIGEVLEGRANSFEPENASSLAAAVKEVRQNREQVQRMASQNQQQIESYTWNARAANIIKFLRH